MRACLLVSVDLPNMGKKHLYVESDTSTAADTIWNLITDKWSGHCMMLRNDKSASVV